MSLVHLCTPDLPDEWFHELSRRAPNIRIHRWAASEEPSPRGVRLDTSGVNHVRQTRLGEPDIPIATLGGIAPIPMAEYARITILELATAFGMSVLGVKRSTSVSSGGNRFYTGSAGSDYDPTELISNDHLDERAPLDRLSDGRISAAALEVFDDEPLLTDSPWRSEPNALLTPHVAGLAPRYRTQTLDLLVENVTPLGVGQPILSEVDRASDF